LVAYSVISCYCCYYCYHEWLRSFFVKLNRYFCLNMWPWVVISKFEVLILK
jgi:hypothetical protein